MTTPAEPATGAGAPATGTASTEPAPTGPPSATDPAATDWASIFEGMTPEEVRTKLDHSRTWEKRAKDNKRDLDNALKSAKPADGEPTTEDLQAQLTEHQEAREAAEARAAELAYQSTVGRIAGTLNLDSEALLDSGSFRDKVADELADDFDDDDLKAAVTKVAKSKDFAGSPRFAGQRTPARSGSDITGGPGGLRQVTEAELTRMTPEQIVEAQNKGQLNALLGI